MTTNRIFQAILRLLSLTMLAFATAAALAQADPPARVASLSHLEGSVVLAPAGETDWVDAVLNRPVTSGDRLWTDPGARAEVHVGSAVLHLADQTFVDVTALDDNVLQASLNEGTVNARVRQLDAGENFEIDTPNLAFRAAQPGDYRIDVDPTRATTRVTVRSGLALVYGAGGESQQVRPGQQIAFGGRDLERVAVNTAAPEDGFDRWAADRNRREDQAIAARYVPRDVVGYHQLDPYGSWAQDPSYGAVWFPRVTVADWAPYRYGHWEWIRPWGWTWIDDAPWGFAPFHYGRWAVIGSRWAWVPGRIGPRPIYAPALVVFVGGTGASWSLSIGSGPGIGWYPLAPGEAWRPFYRASPVYVRNVNRHIVVRGDDPVHIHRRRAEAVTAVRVEDFSRGRPVNRHWSRVNPAEVARAPIAALPAMPEPRRFGGTGRSAITSRPQPPVHTPAPSIIARPQPPSGTPGAERRERGDQGRPGFRPREEGREPPRRRDEQRSLTDAPRGPVERPPQARQEERRDEQRSRDERRALEEQLGQQAQQLRLQQQERARRDQQALEERVQRQQQVQVQVQRGIDDQRRAQQAQIQREHALRQQQAAQERVQRQQETQQQRAAQQAQIQREHALRQQQAAQERVQRRQEMQQQQRAAQQQLSGPPAAAPGAVQPGPPRGEGRERGGRGQAAEQREQRRSRGDDEGRGRGQGQGQWR